MDDELIVMKAELQRKVVELENATSDISNLLANTNIATLFLDNDQHIRRFTPAATQFFSLLPTDAGRPLTDINSKLVYDQLHADCRVLLIKLIPVQKEVVATNGKWLNLISRGETMRIILISGNYGLAAARHVLTFTYIRAVAQSSQMSTKGLLESCYAFAAFMMKCFPETETPSIR